MRTNNKKVLLFIILVVCALFFSGCLEKNTLETNADYSNSNFLQYTIGLHESVRINQSGGEFSLINNSISLDIPQGAVDQEITLSIESIEDPLKNGDLIMISCFECGPNGTTFLAPIELIISYIPDELPRGFDENDLKLYLFNDTNWVPIENSFVNSERDWVVSEINHFSKMGCAFSTPSSDSSTDIKDGEEEALENGSALIWFKPNVDVIQSNHRRPGCGPYYEGEDDMTEYEVFAVIWWDPVSYVHYYEMKFEFNGNPPKPYCPSCEYRDWGKSWCELAEPWFPKEGFIYNLGGDPEDGYAGSFDDSGKIGCEYLDGNGTSEEIWGRMWPEGKHGYLFFAIHDTVLDLEELSTYEKSTLQSEMLGFVQSYIDKWDIWIRAVTETEE